MRAAGQQQEARLLHLAYALVLRGRGDLRAARRELLAGDELAAQLTQHLIFRYELAALVAQVSPDAGTQTMLATVVSQFELLWRLRLDRRTMLRQAGRRPELEAAQVSADLAASSDALTGLGNRRMFDRRINEMRGVGALLLIDVDKFKHINDTFPHRAGDRVLVELAAVLRAHCRHDGVAIRFGGDEFAMFLSTGVREAGLEHDRGRTVGHPEHGPDGLCGGPDRPRTVQPRRQTALRRQTQRPRPDGRMTRRT